MQVNSKVSVIIPNYNHSLYLKKRIESVLNQTYHNFEIIILDDCSTDDSKNVINQYVNHPKTSHLVFNTKNSGSTFLQWQKGIALASGKFIWIAESDDYADKLFLEEAMKRFNSDSDIGMVYCDSNVVKDEIIDYDFYKRYRNDNFVTDRWSHDYVTVGSTEINNFLIYDCTINNTSALVFKKNLVNDNLFKYLKQFKYSGDWYFFLAIATNCKISYINNALNYFRQGTNNFAKGIKSPLNHFKERSLVRYLFLKNFPSIISNPKKVFLQIGTELKFKIFELIKNPSNLIEFLKVCNVLIKNNKNLFFEQLKYLVIGNSK